MKKVLLSFVTLGFLAFSFTFSLPAFAGVQGDLTFKTLKGQREGEVYKGKYFYQGQKVLVEYQLEKKAPQSNPSKKGNKNKQKNAKKDKTAKKESKEKNTTKVPKGTKHVKKPTKKGYVVDQNNLQANYFLHSQKRFMPLDLNQNRNWEWQYVNKFLMTGGILVNREEMKKLGWDVKQLNEEKLDGQRVTAWYLEQKTSAGNQVVKMWTANELDHIPIKVLFTDIKGKQTEMKLTNLKQTQLATNLFQPPEQYTVYAPKIVQMNELSAEEQKSISEMQKKPPLAPKGKNAKKK